MIKQFFYIKELKLGYCTPEKISIDEEKAKTLPVKYNVDLIRKLINVLSNIFIRGFVRL